VWLVVSGRESGDAFKAGTRGARGTLLRVLVLAVALAAAWCTRAATDPAAQVVEQKLRLLESYFESATARRIVDGGNAEALNALAQARGLVVDAHNALDRGDAPLAKQLADDALRAFSAASRASGRPAAQSAGARTQYQELRDAISAFRASLGKTSEQDPAAVVFEMDLAALDAELARAATLAQQGYFDRANSALTEVYRSTMQAIAAARDSETVIYKLEFNTPADELDYERQRFRGNELLLEMLQAGGANERANRLAQRYAMQARERRDAAEKMAGAGDVQGAIGVMEEASSLLARALSTLGLPMAR
jgi:hypothetical protein